MKRLATAEGSIPACAGEPSCPFMSRQMPTVYPRVCGGTARTAGVNVLVSGLSPRVRGNPVLLKANHHWRRSIPACAGEPRTIACSFSCVKVYPACAGEPCQRSFRSTKSTVYPRVCGGTLDAIRAISHGKGLSPRVRGNHKTIPPARPCMRSIPACAGEPLNGQGRTTTLQVYPRVCGGTAVIIPVKHLGHGLSPRVRGNPLLPDAVSLGLRSIPACAGNRIRLRSWKGTKGSIPACAGEPGSPAARFTRRTVYPRVCGGTG